MKSPRHSDITIQSNSDEEQIHDVMMSLLDRIEKELNPSSDTNTCMLFDAPSNLQHLLSRDSPEKSYPDDQTFFSIRLDEPQSDDSMQMSNDLFQPLDEYRHSIGILLDDDDQQQQDESAHRILSSKVNLKLEYI